MIAILLNTVSQPENTSETTPMGSPAAKQGDHVTATDYHLIQPPGPSTPVLVPHSFLGTLNSELSRDVKIQGQAAAIVGSIAKNQPKHVPIGGSFVNPPTDEANIIQGSATVFINGKPAARSGDVAMTCNDPVPLPVGTVQATGTVFIGG